MLPKTDRRVIAPWGWGQSLAPGIHLVLCGIAASTSAHTPGGTWYRLIPIDPLCGILLWGVTSNLGAFALFAILGTLQWYLIGLVIVGILKRLF